MNTSLPLLVIATHNAHKTSEIARMLSQIYEVKDLSSYPSVPETEETGDTFAENAALKALAASRLIPGIVLADDSGLCVDALDGAPGVRSARYAGEDGDSAHNNAKLLAELSRMPANTPRTAHFQCTMVLAENGRILTECEGRIDGSILTEMRGAQGFGYDPLFVPNGYSETFAELPADVKNSMSHRGRALEKAIAYLKGFAR